MQFDVLTRAPQVSQSISTQILEAIRAGAYPEGTRLPTEVELARQFGVSRPSVREALAALQFAGHVESRRGYGSVVAHPRPVAPQATKPPDHQLRTARDAVDLLEARLLVEPYALAVAAADPDRQVLAEASDLIRGMSVAVDEPDLHAETDLLVHRALLMVCPNRSLRATALSLIDRSMDLPLLPARLKAWAAPVLPHVWTDQHAAAHAALAAGDAAAARAASIGHLRSVVDNIAASLVDEPEVGQQVADALRRLPWSVLP